MLKAVGLDPARCSLETPNPYSLYGQVYCLLLPSRPIVPSNFDTVYRCCCPITARHSLIND
ncbi:hypothetical protein BT63DRAFT_430298 [Microthyrium microscopicum]|uniref:Uncharacterized protein n=1 Tax=Microthyrium microscopicum TaxID=703497 RepID=A0A6A6TTQ8_9PEZI|nr:hypothetical protein BT63DRAFT_430298 [Microthyrium microscopicum]